MAAQSFHPTILLTRPAAQSTRFAKGLDADVVISPLIAPVFPTVDLPTGDWAAVILTSETGAEAAGRMRDRLPDLAFCVGQRTAEVARKAGFATRSADGDAEALLALILSTGIAPLLHLRGREARGDLAERLSAKGMRCDGVVVYAQEAQPLTAQAIDLLRGDKPVIVPLFSPRTAEILAVECRRIAATAPLIVIAMSAAVAEAARPLGAPTIVAAHPDADSMGAALRAQLVAGQGA